MTDSQLPLFHATLREFSAGEIVSATSQGGFYPEVIALLESRRPINLPSRSTCVFASDKAVASTRFLLGQGAKLEDVKLYRVEMNLHHRAPFRVIHELDKRVKASGAVDALVSEYWNPQREWAFWEYFGPSLKVIEESPHVSQMDLYAFDIKYGHDVDLSGPI